MMVMIVVVVLMMAVLLVAAVKAMFSNTLILAIALGFVVNLANLPVPVTVGDAIDINGLVI